jgi:hypothetical protein
MTRLSMFFVMFVIILVLMVSIVSGQEETSEEAIDSGETIDCSSTFREGLDEYSKGLKVFDESQNTEGTCAPIAAGVSQHWFQEKCGLEYSKRYSTKQFISRMEEKMIFKRGAGTKNGDLFLGTREFLEEEGVGDCFNITVMACPSNVLVEFSLVTEEGEVIGRTPINPSSESRPNDLINKYDKLIRECPQHEDVIRELGKGSDVLISYVGHGFAHTVAVDGIGGEGINVNSNGLPSRLRGPLENEFDNGVAEKHYRDIGREEFYEEDRDKVSGKERYEANDAGDFPQAAWMYMLVSVTPNGNCNMDCPEVDYIKKDDLLADTPSINLDSSINSVIAYDRNGKAHVAQLSTKEDVLTVALEDEDYLYMKVKVNAKTESYLYAGNQVIGPFLGEKEITIGYAESFQLVSTGEVGGVKGDVYNIGEPVLGGFNFGFDVGRLTSQLMLNEITGEYSATDLGGFPLSSALKGSYLATKEMLDRVFD